VSEEVRVILDCKWVYRGHDEASSPVISVDGITSDWTTTVTLGQVPYNRERSFVDLFKPRLSDSTRSHTRQVRSDVTFVPLTIVIQRLYLESVCATRGQVIDSIADLSRVQTSIISDIEDACETIIIVENVAAHGQIRCVDSIPEDKG
jgi:hypothetical protein